MHHHRKEIDMRFVQLVRKGACIALAASLVGAPVIPAQAAMISTAQMITAEQGNADRARLASLLDREDLQRELAALGVDVAHAKQRVAALTDAEVQQLSQRIGTLPAGGASAAGILVLLFLILVATDLLGITDVFTFVHPAR